jgi:hypothetical protein
MEKPVFLFLEEGGERAQNAAAVKRRIWETAMRGGFRRVALPDNAPDPLGNAMTRALLECAQLLRRSRFWRLEPHTELAGKADESEEDRRKRRRIEESIDRQKRLPNELRENLKTEDRGASCFVLANPGREYLLYFPAGGSTTLDLLEAFGKLNAVWFEIGTGKAKPAESVQGGAYLKFEAPDTGAWALLITRP